MIIIIFGLPDGTVLNKYCTIFFSFEDSVKYKASSSIQKIVLFVIANVFYGNICGY